MAITRKKRKKNPLKVLGKYFADFGVAVRDGDGFVKGSLGLMGLGYMGHKQVVKGVLVTLAEILFIVLCFVYFAPTLSNLVVTPAEREAITGTVEAEGDTYYGQTTIGAKQFVANDDPFAALTGGTDTSNTTDYDDSLLIIINSMISIFLIIMFIIFYIHNIKACYALQRQDEQGKHISTFGEDVKALFSSKFHLTLLTLPTLGVILMNVIPVMILIAIAFTNYTQAAMPPSYLLSWVGWENFASLFGGTVSKYFNYAFGRVLLWTLVWALLATLTCFIGGILLAALINSKNVVFPKMWRTFFVICIAVPQFVSLILVRNFFASHGIVNTIFSDIGFNGWLYEHGLIPTADSIPFLTDKNWAKFMIIMINIWVGVPYQMLIATGLLMNIPVGQVESAKIDGANKFQIFQHIIMPYILVVQGPALITDFVRNINNFNVIYLLTQDVYTTLDMNMAGASAKEVDLLVTWLFRLTNEDYNYSMASVIGILVFIICAAFTLISFARMMKGGMEEDLR